MNKSNQNGSDVVFTSSNNKALPVVAMIEYEDIPRAMDVILGRGKSYGKHPGNMIFQGT